MSKKQQPANTHRKCLDCLQEGDPRAFGPCHKSISQTHRKKATHTGFRVLAHGPRDVREKRKSRLRKTAIGLSATAVVTAAVHAIPGASVVAAIGTNASTLAATITVGTTILSAASAIYGETAKDTRALDDMILTSDGSKVTPEKTEKLLKDLKGLIALRGKCGTCNKMVDQEPCRYIWTCCKKTRRQGGTQPSEQDPMLDGCKVACTKCKIILPEDEEAQKGHKTQVPDCLKQCSGCGAVEGQEKFNTGCATTDHRLE